LRSMKLLYDNSSKKPEGSSAEPPLVSGKRGLEILTVARVPFPPAESLLRTALRMLQKPPAFVPRY
jgi:hypothetical protein